MKDVYQILQEQVVPYVQYDHKPVFTTAESEFLKDVIPGKQCKNLFLTNEKGTKHFLVTIEHSKRANLKELGAMLGQKGLRFASPERLKKHLGLTPGSVSPLGLINDENGEVIFLMDEELTKEEMLYCHPNINTATIGIKLSDFRKLLTALGREIQTIQVS